MPQSRASEKRGFLARHLDGKVSKRIIVKDWDSFLDSPAKTSGHTTPPQVPHPQP